jgi:hypothetical protein
MTKSHTIPILIFPSIVYAHVWTHSATDNPWTTKLQTIPNLITADAGNGRCFYTHFLAPPLNVHIHVLKLFFRNKAKFEM